MSKIVSPYPSPLNEEVISAKPGHSWWRYRLRRMNDDGHLMIMKTNEAAPTWVSVEFFDGFDTVIDAGFDKPIGAVRFCYEYRYGDWIDILSEKRPSPSPDWQQLGLPGDRHPDD